MGNGYIFTDFKSGSPEKRINEAAILIDQLKNKCSDERINQ